MWSACTEPDRISRWLAPIDGDLRLDGAFQLKDNAGGKILRCEEPHLIKVTWALGKACQLRSKSASPMAKPAAPSWSWSIRPPPKSSTSWCAPTGPGARSAIGGGWDLTLFALDLFLNGTRFDPATWEDTPEAKEFATRSCQAWGPPIQAAWGTSDDDIAAAIAFSAALRPRSPSRRNG